MQRLYCIKLELHQQSAIKTHCEIGGDDAKLIFQCWVNNFSINRDLKLFIEG